MITRRFQVRIAGAAASALLLAGCAMGDVAGGTSVPSAVPRTTQAFADPPGQFRFVIVGDRTGGHRPGVFEKAMDQINLLAPAFVIGVGDHIEGYTEDQAVLVREWDEFDAATAKLKSPFFHVVGNHDIGNEVMRALWRKRMGRDVYHFRYRDVLFVALNTEDPPPPKSNKRELLKEYSPQEMQQVIGALQAGDAAVEAIMAQPRLRSLVEKFKAADQVSISQSQIDYVRKTLADNRDARWTFFLMHRPGWRYASPQFKAIEALAAGRPHSFVAGHFHSYAYQQRDGVDYIQMGTTGGLMDTNPANGAAMDHVLYITMTPSGPEIANIRLDGLLDRRGPVALKKD
ncbi:metallophosphoesterase family protein [Sphingomonas sp. KC8]|uniref:metallophosphoesterase family protein n=1 Tax=Sphingomonas sp. KC8 TaxID=1030157 RepID=UPI0002488A41|nr:metallophosphoesterase [Sphingomonas sp. KC8]ARS25723.1 putative beta-galactosidase [Sphingomonas sp. KC8]